MFSFLVKPGIVHVLFWKSQDFLSDFVLTLEIKQIACQVLKVRHFLYAKIASGDALAMTLLFGRLMTVLWVKNSPRTAMELWRKPVP